MIPVKPKDVTWTDDQWEAIYDDNKNIIVSAGAGSGKTAVLTERVIRKLRDGVHINELLILTFTKAASLEMADRIRKKIKKIPELSKELNLLNSSYITTFDSFALSVVKKYHYLLNLSDNINIIDDGIINIKKNNVMDELFLELYDSKDSKFLNFIKSFCVKDDSDIRGYLININNKLDLLSDKYIYLNNYIDNFYSDSYIDKCINNYLNIINDKIIYIKELVKGISYIDSDFANKISDSLYMLYNYNSYDDLVTKLNIKLPVVPRGSDEELKNLKSTISDIIKEIKKLCCYDNANAIKSCILCTKENISVIIDILIEFSKRIDLYKRKLNSYEFSDIAIMAINLLKENDDVREELFNSFKEIMIDEYQDTNDLQEEFISMISNHNVYMVGDIKQSIYRFRNANPYLFKNKYDDYSSSDIDRKIDLKNNFRSRCEVINDINTIFNLIMSDMIGGASYLDSHQMIFGNDLYNKNIIKDSCDMDIYCYNYDKNSKYSRDEIEAFFIARDIIDKYNNKYQVLDKETNSLRDVKYSDFAIIMDRATNFDLYKRIFSYLGIPINIFKSDKLNDSDDINVIRNLIGLILKIKDKKYDTEFKYLFVSVARSFLINYNDEVIFDYFYNSNFKDSNLYGICLNISKKIDYITIHELLDIIVNEFNYYDNLITIGNIESNIIKLDKLYDVSYNLESIGYDVRDFYMYLTDISSFGYSIEYDNNSSLLDGVRIMTIHKSKGLEYPICYFSGLYKKFNISDLREKFLYDKEYGIVIPYFDCNYGIGETIYKELIKDRYLIEEISEKIRLFYVALTRAREKIIMVKPYSDKVIDNCNISVLEDSIKKNYRSFDDILNSIYFRINNNYKYIDLDKLNLNSDYKLIKVGNFRDNIKNSNIVLDVKELNIDNNIISNNTFSKVSNELISKNEYNNMNMGTKIHEILELIDLKNPNLDLIDNKYYKDIVYDFLNQDIVKNINSAKIYKEYEFIYYEDDNKYHGIIDLMLEYDDYIDIIDYKLKNVTDSNYIKQLNGYKDYISNKSNKDVNIYLYSLMDRKIIKLD